MKNVRIILLLSVILCFLYFIKIHEGVDGFFDFLGSDDQGTASTDETSETNMCVPDDSQELTAEESRIRSSLMETCHEDDSIRFLNNAIADLPEATLVYPLDPASLKYFNITSIPTTPSTPSNTHYSLDPNNTKISYNNNSDNSFNNIIKDDNGDLQRWWKYDFFENTETPKINIKNSENEDIHTNVDLVYLSGCSQIIRNDNTPQTCYKNTNLVHCNLQEDCVWDALCEQPIRGDDENDKIYTPKECIRKHGIFRADLLQYATNTIVNDLDDNNEKKISTSFNVEKIGSLWGKLTSEQTAEQNDSDSCSFFPTDIYNTEDGYLFDSYFDSSCYNPVLKKIGLPDLDKTIGLETDNGMININRGGISEVDNPYNIPQNFFSFKHSDTCNWSKRSESPEAFSRCFDTNIKFTDLPQGEWQAEKCTKWSTSNLENCSSNDVKTILNTESDRTIPPDYNLEKIKEYCCLPQKTCDNSLGINTKNEETPTLTPYTCEEPGYKLSLPRKGYECTGTATDHTISCSSKLIPQECIAIDGCSWSSPCGDGECTDDICCERSRTCSDASTDISCSETSHLKSNLEESYCLNDEGNTVDCDDSNFQDQCCLPNPSCHDHEIQGNTCNNETILTTDVEQKCTDQDCSDFQATCCLPKASCSSYTCSEHEGLVPKIGAEGNTPNCDTHENSSCNNDTCCELQETCGQKRITCDSGKILDENRIFVDDSSCCIDDGASLTPPRNICANELYPGECNDEAGANLPNSTVDNWKICPDQDCDYASCCPEISEKYFCRGPEATRSVIDNGVIQPASSSNLEGVPCGEEGLGFTWHSCYEAFNYINDGPGWNSYDLFQYPYIGDLFRACDLEPPSPLVIAPEKIPARLDVQPTCSPDICNSPRVLKTPPPQICSSYPCTEEECCETEKCEHYFLNNTCPGGDFFNKSPDTECDNPPCIEGDCCLGYDTNALYVTDDIDSINTLLSELLESMNIQDNSYFSSDEWAPDIGGYLSMKYIPKQEILPEGIQYDPSTNYIGFYVKGRESNAQDTSNLITTDAITGASNSGELDILTFIVEINNLNLKSTITIPNIPNIPIIEQIIIDCGDDNFLAKSNFLYKFRFYTENSVLKLATSNSELLLGNDPKNDPIFLSTSEAVEVTYTIGDISGDNITFGINDILNTINNALNTHQTDPPSSKFEDILLKLLMLKTKDIYNMFFNHDDNSSNIPDGITITRDSEDLLDNFLCQLDFDINGGQWSVNGIAAKPINKMLDNYSDNFIEYQSTFLGSGGPTINTHFDVCDSLTLSDSTSLLIRLKELILTGTDIYTLYNQSPVADQFDKEPIGCNSSTLSDGSFFTAEEIPNITSIIEDFTSYLGPTLVGAGTRNSNNIASRILSFITDLDISNLQYSQGEKLYYNNGSQNINKIVLTIS
jgi:hypothetical protein